MPTHPQVIHFPIVFFLLAFGLEMISYFFKKELLSIQSLILLILSIIGAYIAIYTGEAAAESALRIPGIQSLLEMHEDAGKLFLYSLLVTTVIKTVLLFWKKDKLPVRMLIPVAMIFTGIQMYQTAFFGGQLVYDRGAGVRPVLEQIEIGQQHDSLNDQNENPDDQPVNRK